MSELFEGEDGRIYLSVPAEVRVHSSGIVLVEFDEVISVRQGQPIWLRVDYDEVLQEISGGAVAIEVDPVRDAEEILGDAS